MVAVKALISRYSADRQMQRSAIWQAAKRRSPGGGCGLEEAAQIKWRRSRGGGGGEGPGRTRAGFDDSPSARH